MSSIFVVVNTNPLTHNPFNGQPFDGIFCQQNGYQVKTMAAAAIYWKRAGAETLAQKLNNGHMDESFDRHQMLHFPNKATPNQYKVKEYTVTEVS